MSPGVAVGDIRGHRFLSDGPVGRQNSVRVFFGCQNDNLSQKKYFWDRPLTFSVFFNDSSTTEIYSLSLHDAFPIWGSNRLAWVKILQFGCQTSLLVG